MDCLGPERVGKCINFCRKPTRRLHVNRGTLITHTKPPGWVGIDCIYCFGWQQSQNAFIKSNCKHGCLPGGINPFPTTSTQKTWQRKSTLALISTTKKANTAPFTKAKKTTSFWSNISLLAQESRSEQHDSNNSKAYIWLLVGILGGFVVLVGLFVTSSKLFRRLPNMKRKTNKIGPNDVIIHQPDNHNIVEVYVIS